jgi:intracellular multiplication protein IcmE
MNDDFDNNDPDLDDANFDEFEDEKSLGGVFRDNPAAKIAAVAGGIVLIFVIIIILGRKSDPLDQSYLSGTQQIQAPPGSEAASQEYIEAIQEVNERDVEIAEATGGSALPTPIEPPVGVLTLPEQESDEEDPLQRWRRLQEERLQRELQQAQTIEPATLPDDGARVEAIQQLSAIMSAQMQAILDSQTNNIAYRSISTPEQYEEEEEFLDDANGNFDGNGLEEEIIQEILLPAGQIAYAQLLIEANTDAPGPVLAHVLSGPLKGGRLIGSFEAQRSVLTLSFSSITLEDGTTLGVNAIALDPNTTLPGLATEVDRRYLARIMLPAAAAFITGFADAIAESGRTTVTISGDTVSEETSDASDDQEVATGIAEMGEELSEIIDEEVEQIVPMIRIAAGTPMGVLFLAPVVTQDDAI